MDGMVALDNAVALLKKHYNLEEADNEMQEILDVPIASLLHKMVADEIKATGIQPARMTSEEKAKVIQNLMNAGVHNMKGAVIEIAKELQISEPTVYRYIKKNKWRKWDKRCSTFCLTFNFIYFPVGEII